jgi:hypothetical protein
MALINSMVADSSKTEEASLVARPPRSAKPAPARFGKAAAKPAGKSPRNRRR